MVIPKKIGVLAFVFMLCACATTPQLSQQERNKINPTLAELEVQLEKARSEQLNLFSPESFNQAIEQYEEANSAAKENENKEALSKAKAGLKLLQKARKNASTTKTLFAEVITAREKANQAGAEKLFTEQLTDLDSDFVDASKLIEEGNMENAKQRRPELQRAYSKLELISLKKLITAPAETALKKARGNDAEKLAPKTFAQAQDEIRLAKSILDIDRKDIKKAKVHVKRATILSQRSENIAEIEKEFDRRDFSNEDIVLWYQNELATISKPLGETLTFAEPNDMTINTLQQQIDRLVVAKNDNQKQLSILKNKLARLDTAHEQQIAQLRQQHTEELASLSDQFQSKINKQEISRADMAALEFARESRFDRIQDMFNDKQAKVYRQKNNILLSVYGFDFPSGNADIKSGNFNLMDKIIKSISKFKNANVVVSGHTDIVGSVDVNKSISLERAQNVAKFLNEVGGIPKERIVAEGYGQTKPVASNQTPEGRALNRRIDVLIVNEQK